MFFVVGKALWLLAVPSNLLILVLLTGLVLASTWRFRRPGSILAGSSTACLLAIGIGPVASWLLLPLEEQFPQYKDDGAPVAGVIVLGGGIYTRTSAERGQLVLGDAAERYIALGDLARRYPNARIVMSGGSGELVPDAMEADIIHRHEDTLGIPSGRVVYENRSRTTWENAIETQKLIGTTSGGRWLLVTSAWHMPRAVGCFRRAGMTVTPYPVDYLTGGFDDLTRLQTAASSGLQRFDWAAKEWVGLLIYRLSGRSSSLFPSPDPASAIR